MSEQVIAQAHLTIIDNNDIESITVEYARNQSTSNAPTSGWSTSRPAWAQGYYIWQRTRIHKSGTSATEDTFGTAVCLTGSTGQTGATGKGITGIETLYATNNSTTTAPTSGWQSQPPTYSSSKPKYWVKVTTTYNSGDPTVVTYLDNGITDAMATATAANTTANNAKNKVDNLETTYNTFINTKAKYFVHNSSGSIVIASREGESSPITFDENTVSTYGYNALTAPSYIALRYNSTELAKLSTEALTFYKPNTTNKGMELTSTALTFYNPSNNNAQLIIGANGTLQSGNYTRGSDSKFSSNGTKIDLINGDIITKYFRVSQGLESGLNAGVYVHGTIEALDGTIGTDSTNYWEIGNGTDYNLNSTAKMIGHGSSYIQLGNSSTWRLATNRIHTGWYTSNDSLLHFPTISSKYWDFGIHVPASGNDKFLYVRSSKANTSASNALQNLLYDIDDTYATAQWDYLFYIDGAGNVHAPAYYVGSEPLTGGVGSIAEKIINSDSTYGKGSTTQPIYIDSNGRPATTTYALNAAGAKGVDTSIAAASTSTNLPTSKAVAAFVEGKGYITSYTDYRVKTEARGSTTMYLAGSNTSGTVSQGILLTDSGVYIQTSSSSTNLVVPKVNGYTLAAASAKGVDTSIADASTSTNLPTSKAVAAFVEGKGYKTTDNNTTYTFANGTNGFTVTPSGGEAQTVTVTPSISNNITGTGTRTSGYLAKFSGTNTITNGPALGTDTTKFLNNKGEWAVPTGTYTYTLPLAANGTRGGVQIGYTQSGKNYPVQLSSEKMYVNVPWENTTYSAGTGLSLSGTIFNHSNSVTAGTAGTSSATSGATLAVPYVTYDAQGHVTGSGTHTHTINNIPQADITWGGPALSGNATPNEVATIDDLGHNKFAFMSAASVEVHYSRDNGSTWTAYGTDNARRSLVTLSQGFRIGGPDAGKNATVNDQLRVQLNANRAGGNIYCNLRRILIYLSTSGSTGCTCTVQTKTIANYNNNVDTWTTTGTYNVSGWSGWNSIPFSEAFGGSSTQTGQIAQIRLIFKATGVVSTSTNLEVFKIRGVAFPLWSSPSTMADTGHLYTYDISQNATFPAQVTATGGFSGNVTGTATGNITSVQYNSTNSKFTYTKNGTNTDIVTIANLKTYLGLGALAYKSSLSKSDVGLGNVDNLSAASIRSGISSSNVTNALGYTPSKTISSIGISGSTITITYSDSTTTTGTMTAAVAEVATQATKLTDANGNAITVGSTSQPVYFSSGVPVGISGTNGAALVGKGANQAPEWKALGSAAYSNTTAFATSAQGTKADSAVQSISFSGTALTISSGAASITQANARTALGLAAAAYKALADSSSASAIGTGTNVTTERDVYYGLPTINNAHNYTSSTTIYAPTAGGTSSQVLIGNGTTSAPVWTDISGIVPSSATNATNATYATYDASEVDNSTKVTIANKYIPKSIGTAAGDIIYWSASGTPTRLAKGSNGQVLKLANGVPTWGSDNNTWDALSTSQAGYVAKAPNDTAKFLRGDASWAAVTKSNVGLGSVDNTADADKRVKGANITTTANAVAYYTDTAGTFGSKASANGALYATSANGALTFGTLPAAQGGTGKTTLKDACNALINALDTGSSNLTANDYVITQYVGGGTTTTTYHRRPASALRVGGLLTARKLKVALGSTTDVTFDGIADVTNIPISGTLGVGNGGTGLTASPSMLTNLGSTTAANVLQASPRPGVTGTLGVANGGTGATSFTANSVIISGSTTTAALTTRAITNVTSGAVTASTNLVTANSLVAHVANKIAAASDTYVTIATDQTITASQKTFNGAIRWGTTSKYGAAHYDSTLEAIVFSFA